MLLLFFLHTSAAAAALALVVVVVVVELDNLTSNKRVKIEKEELCCSKQLSRAFYCKSLRFRFFVLAF
jgi:hypothetical protein